MSRPRNEGESRVQSFRREWGYPHHDDGDDDDDHDDGDDDDDDDDDGDQAVPTQKPGQVAILNRGRAILFQIRNLAKLPL